MTLYGILIYAMRSRPTLEQAFLWEKGVIAVVPLMAVVFYHFTVHFTQINIKKWIIPSGYAICTALILISRTDLIISGMQIKAYGYAPISEPLFYPLTLFAFVVMIMALLNLITYARGSPLSEQRNRGAYIVVGIFLSLFGGLLDLLPLMGLPLYPGAIIGNIIFCILTAVAIVKYHLLDIRIVFRKGLTYLIVSTIVAIPYIGIIILFNYAFGRGNIPVWAHLILLLLLALLFPVLWQRAQNSVDRWFYRERYDFLKQLEAFSEEIHDISDLRQLSNSMVNLTRQALQISSVHLLLLTESGDFTTAARTGKSKGSTLKSQSPIIQWFQSNRDILDRKQLNYIPRLQAMSARERRTIEDIGVEIIIPLKTMTEELIGIFMLGKKLSEQPYSEEDKRLITAVTSRVAIELENARLYAAETATRKELQRQNDQKMEFLHTVAHELKTPLTSLIAAIELMTDKPDISSSHKQRLIDILKNSTGSMDRRVSELLVLARMQTGDLELDIRPLDINIFLSDVASQLSILFNQKEQALRLEIESQLSIVKADRDRLEQIIFNLITNAIKYSPAYTEIILRAQNTNRQVIIEIEDSAPLIDTEESKRLFDPYYRGQDTDGEHLPGLGLGLFLAKRLVELHGGEIWVKAMPGKGNVFAFSLQAADTPAEDS